MSKLIKLHLLGYSEERAEDGFYSRIKGEPVLVNPNAILYVGKGYYDSLPSSRIRYSFDPHCTYEVWESVEEITALLEVSK